MIALPVSRWKRARSGHLRDQEVGVALPPRAAGVGGTALGLEHVPVERLLRREHEWLVDLRERRCLAGGRALGPELLAHQERAGGHTSGCFQECSPREI